MRTIRWQDGVVVTVDQTKLPHKTLSLKLKSYEEVAEAIRTMKIRGAPLLGAAAAFALALVAYHSEQEEKDKLISELEEAAKVIKNTRPTAVNLFWATDRILRKARNHPQNIGSLVSFVVNEAKKIASEDAASNRLIGKHGAELLDNGDTILTHCNAGALATVEYGTALGVIRAAWEQGKRIQAVATETRPKLQGARLTVYELKQEGIPTTLITDNMVGYAMYRRLISKVIVGADRIVQDAIINKIGTYTIAVLAEKHQIPFYVAAPKSTFDLEHSAKDVNIEERDGREVTHIGSQLIAPRGIDVWNPAFDVTPMTCVTAIICEDGVLHQERLAKWKDNK